MQPAQLGLGGSPRPRIGLLGGSFNPAHAGHLHVSLEALRRLALDEVWWLVAPQNPLKSPRGMAPFKKRLSAAQTLAHHPRIKVLDLETRLGTRFTVDTLREIQRRFPKTHFVWLMGADILAQIRHWKHWMEIFSGVPIAVFARPTYCFRGLAELAAKRFRRQRVRPEAARRLAAMAPPAWMFLPTKLDPTSATEIRSSTAPPRKSRQRRPQRKRR